MYFPDRGCVRTLRKLYVYATAMERYQRRPPTASSSIPKIGGSQPQNFNRYYLRSLLSQRIRGYFYNEMRYIYLRFTYLLTYLLTYYGLHFWLVRPTFTGSIQTKAY